MIPAVAGWRVVCLDRENGGSVALPIVAWEPVEGFLHAWCLHREQGIPPGRVNHEHVLGYLSPGDEHESFWEELAEDEIRRQNEEEDRAFTRRAALQPDSEEQG